MFRYENNTDKTFLVGAYRTEKSQLEWILGEKPGRYLKLYNVRYNHDLFTVREGGVTTSKLPDFVLIYDATCPNKGYHLFVCVSSSIKGQDEMERLEYPKPQGSYMVYVLGEELQSEPVDIDRLLSIQNAKGRAPFSPAFLSGKEIASAVDLTLEEPEARPVQEGRYLRFIDLFAGIGGIRCGLEQAARAKDLTPVCVFTSEIKPYAVKVLRDNHPAETINGDITKVDTANIPDFDILCAGFPCQAFSTAGKRKGFADTRGTMFFEVERILRDKRPKGFILENVEGLVNHDGGNTLRVIVERLEALNYKFGYRVLNARHFGVPQERKRIYIVGSLYETPDLDKFPVTEKKLGDVMENGLQTADTPFVRTLLKHYSTDELSGKSIKDKRGGPTNIHSWDLEIKGPVSHEQKILLDAILKKRRSKKWAQMIGIEWMDGMPLTAEQISTFYKSDKLNEMLEDLADKGYLKIEHPKKLVKETTPSGVKTSHREYDTTKPKGYNIVAGKLSFEVSKIMSPDEIAPTLVAMDMEKLYVCDNGGLRKLSLREGLRLCGYPDDMIFEVSEEEGFDLIGNTVVVPVIKAVAERLLDKIIQNGNI